MKRILSLILSLVLLCGCTAIPMSALAENDVITLNVFYATSRPMNDATELTRKYFEDHLGININLIQGEFCQLHSAAGSATSLPTTCPIWCCAITACGWSMQRPARGRICPPTLEKSTPI